RASHYSVLIAYASWSSINDYSVEYLASKQHHDTQHSLRWHTLPTRHNLHLRELPNLRRSGLPCVSDDSEPVDRKTFDYWHNTGIRIMLVLVQLGRTNT